MSSAPRARHQGRGHVLGAHERTPRSCLCDVRCDRSERRRLYRTLYALIQIYLYPSHCTPPFLSRLVIALAQTRSDEIIDVILQQPGQGFCLDLDVQQRLFFATLPLLVDHYTKLGAHSFTATHIAYSSTDRAAGLLKETCNFDYRDLSVSVIEDEPLDDDYLWNLDQCTHFASRPSYFDNTTATDSKSFVKQIAEAQGAVSKRRLEDAPADSDFLVRDSLLCFSCLVLRSHKQQKWTVFAASMTPPPRVDGSVQPQIAEHLQRLEQRLELYRLTFRRQPPNDASCQFVALADQLHGKVEKAAGTLDDANLRLY